MAELTHLDETGAARMVDVSAKPTTTRTRRGRRPHHHVRRGRSPRSAPAAPPRATSSPSRASPGSWRPSAPAISSRCAIRCRCPRVTIDLALDDTGITATATVRTDGKTGVEMEALTAVSVALLTLYDMAKAMDKAMTIGDIRLLSKTGGKSGDWVRG